MKFYRRHPSECVEYCRFQHSRDITAQAVGDIPSLLDKPAKMSYYGNRPEKPGRLELQEESGDNRQS